MKLNKSLAILACGALVFASCQDDILDGKGTPAKVGDEIVFGGSMSFEDAVGGKTRTVYGDKGENATEIKWYKEDKLRIYCAEATLGDGETTQKYCDYVVTDGVEGSGVDKEYESKHSTGLDVLEGGMGLRWGADTQHTFYGVYPAPAQLAASNQDAESQAASRLLNLTGNTLKAQLPNKQHTTYTETKGTSTERENKHTIIHPAMRYAYMVAKQTASPADGNVVMTFEPIVAAVEISLVNKSVNKETGKEDEPQQIADIEMLSITSEYVVCGNFTCNIDDKTVTANETADAYKTVTIPLDQKLTLEYGDTITFTAFMIMNNDLSGLDNIRVGLLAGGVTKTAKLTTTSNNGLIVSAKKKNFIKNVPVNLGKTIVVDYSNWMQLIPETETVGTTTTNTLVSKLSIPGAGGATSAGIITGDVNKQQTLSITELWNQGIRCFEFMVDRNGEGANNDISGMPVICNLQNTGMTLQGTMDEITTCLKNNPTEFAVVIIGYQDVAIDEYNRNAGDTGFGGQFLKWWNSYSFSGKSETNPQITHAKGLLTSSTTVAEARGKLFCIARPVSMGTDAGWHTGIANGNQTYDATNHPFVSALGWGNHPDQWYMRGFGDVFESDHATNRTNYENFANVIPTTGATSRPYFINENKNEKDLTYTVPATKSFAYKFVDKTDESFSNAGDEWAWVQEWRRVVPSAEVRTQYGIKNVSGSVKGFDPDGSNYSWQWAPSVNEKWNDITTALDMAMNNTGGYKLYINSLCGYFVDGDIELSYIARPTFQRYPAYRTWLLTYIYNMRYCLDDKYGSLVSDGLKVSNSINPESRPTTTESAWGPYRPKGGAEGNIADYAHWVNNLFYNHLQTVMSNPANAGKSTGIVLMDRVSDSPAENAPGYYIPKIIISNNKFDSNLYDQEVSVNLDTYAQDDTPAAPVRK